jgi:hypothetical protein
MKIAKYKQGRGLFLFFLILLCGLLGVYKPVDAQELESKQKLPDRFLVAEGKVLKNQTGEVITLRGTNIGGWQVMEQWMCPTNSMDQKTTIATLTERFGKEKAEELIKVYEQNWWQEKDFDNIKDLKFNVIRLPISYFNLLDEEGKLRSDTLATIDWFVSECEERDIYVILDLHAAPGSQNGRDHSGDKSGSILFTDEASQNLTVSLWEQLASHYKGNATIAGYDLLNEPEGTEAERAPWGRVQLPFYDRLYKAIRAIDPDHLIILNAVWEPTNMPHPEVYGWENVMYEYHYYCWDGTDNASVQKKFTESKVKNTNQAGHEVPVLIGEFTLFDRLQSWEHALRTYEENGWSWTTWTYKTVDRGNWGIYNSTSSSTPIVNIYNDTAETIASKWGKVGTEESFKKNQYLYDLLQMMADPKAAEEAHKEWFQNCNTEVILRSGEQAEAELVLGSETHAGKKEDMVVRLTLSGEEAIPSATKRNVCISPVIRNSVNATGLNYLIFDVFTRQGNRALQVTLVDKAGRTWTGFTSKEAMPVAYEWEKVFIDISKADIDVSSIIEIRIGANASGTYYFDDFYFASSYTAPQPTQTVEQLQLNMGDKGVITDWDVSNKENSGKPIELPNTYIVSLAIVGGLVLLSGVIFLLIKKKKKIAKIN